MPDIADTPAPSAEETAMASFDQHMAAAGVDAPVVEEAKPAPSKVEAPKPEIKSFADLPAELLGDAKVETKVETKPEDDFEKLVSETPTGQIKHEHFKRVQDGAKTEVARVRAELEAAKADIAKRIQGVVPPELATEVKTLKDTLAKRTQELERVAYERSDKFREKFTVKETQLRDQVARIGKEYGVEEDTIASIMSASGKRRDAIIDELEITDGAKRRLDAHLVQLDQLGTEREAELGRSREELTAWRQEQKAQAEAEDKRRVAEEDGIFSSALDEARTKLAAFRKIEGNEAWNAAVAERETFAKNFFNGGASMKEMADLALLGMDHGVQVKIIGAVRAENAALKEQVTKLTAANPGGGAAPGYKPDETGLSDEERMKRTFDQAMAAAGAGA